MTGGIGGLQQSFAKQGMGDVVSSWIGTGQNMPVSADQIQQVLGNEQIKAFAQKAGISSEAAGPQLAALLPGIVDKLTPGGQIPQGGDLMSSGMGFLAMGVARGTRIATVMLNSPEWNFFDMGIMQAGAIQVHLENVVESILGDLGLRRLVLEVGQVEQGLARLS